jgi:hypothetical protein
MGMSEPDVSLLRKGDLLTFGPVLPGFLLPGEKPHKPVWWYFRVTDINFKENTVALAPVGTRDAP